MKKKTENDLMEKIVSLAKRRGFVFPGSEIYGGLANSWDYGPLGVELKNNIKKFWWKRFVQERDDMVGIDSAIIMNPKVWEASGHLKEFSDPLVECKKCKKRFRWDSVEVKYEGSRAEIEKLGSDEDVTGAFWLCENCGAKNLGIETKGREGDLREKLGVRQFHLMFRTFLGPAEEKANEVYLRPETAQGMFVNFKNVLDTARRQLPFGIAQIGKAFRNEITPGNFVFRTREFEMMELEYFVREEEWEKWFEHWKEEMLQWMKDTGIDVKKVYAEDVPDGERAHYSKRTIDFEFDFPFGKKELYGLAYRGNFDLKNHMQASGENLWYTSPNFRMRCKSCGKLSEFEPSSGPRSIRAIDVKDCKNCDEGNLIPEDPFLPHVIEPSWGVDRTVLAVLLSAYEETDDRVVLHLKPHLAPYKAAVFPLLANKPELVKLAREVYDGLRQGFRTGGMRALDGAVAWDDRGNIGKRYYSQDEIGTPFCITVDFESLEKQDVTVRDRDTMKQERVMIEKLTDYLRDRIAP